MFTYIAFRRGFGPSSSMSSPNCKDLLLSMWSLQRHVLSIGDQASEVPPSLFPSLLIRLA
jgi:hypothetical protein